MKNIGINVAAPQHQIHMVVGTDEFTDRDIRKWAQGDVSEIGSVLEPIIIKYLAQIVVEKVLL